MTGSIGSVVWKRLARMPSQESIAREPFGRPPSFEDLETALSLDYETGTRRLEFMNAAVRSWARAGTAWLRASIQGVDYGQTRVLLVFIRANAESLRFHGTLCRQCETPKLIQAAAAFIADSLTC